MTKEVNFKVRNIKMPNLRYVLSVGLAAVTLSVVLTYVDSAEDIVEYFHLISLWLWQIYFWEPF